MENKKYKVCIRCMTYNHALYIKNALDGFVSQVTDFPYVCVIIDDASTDGEQEILRNYIADNFMVEKPVTETSDFTMTFGQHKVNQNCYFAVYFLKYNHFRKKSKLPYVQKLVDSAIYIALCEGDDYWISPYKLQKQVNLLDGNNDFSFCFHKCKTTSGNPRYPEVKENSVLTAKDIILTHYIPTASLMYRIDYLKNVTYYKLTIGDMPLEIQLAMNGDVAYIDEYMSVYRDDNTGSITHNKEHNRRGIYDYLKMYSMLWWKYKFRKYSIYLFYKMLRSVAQLPLIYRNVYLRS